MQGGRVKRIGLLALVLSAAMIAGCAAPRQQGVNYGHPSLNAAFNKPVPPPPDPARMALGALAGGVIGARFGRGDGRLAATGAGAAIGAMVAHGQGYNSDMAAGALLGGLAGSRFGQGSGRLAATAIGAGLGAFLTVPKE
jgi:uncharacterized protein YcfJ